jgi:tRNA G46 methylase TrmB
MKSNKDAWERGNQPYLKAISELSFEKMKWTRKSVLEIRDFLSPWSHNIKLPYNIFTASCDDYYPSHKEMMRIINQQLKGSFKKKRILDIGSLEGYFSAECALQGAAAVLGVEGRVLNIKKCEFIKSVLGITNLTFVRDDAMKIRANTAALTLSWR